MNAPDLLAMHEWMKHWAYVQAQAHPLNSEAWLQFPYYAYGFTVLSVGGFIGWWLRGLARRVESVLVHEHLGRRFERLSSGHWGKHKYDPETRELLALEVSNEEPPGVTRSVKLNSPRQKLV